MTKNSSKAGHQPITYIQWEPFKQLPLSYTSRPSFSIVLSANLKLERKTCNTRVTLLWSHFRCDIWDVRKFIFYPELSSISSLKIYIFSLLNNYSKFIIILFYHRSDCQNALQQRLLLSSTCHVTMWTIGLNVVVFIVRISRRSE